ncbi:hypothetical protein [Halorussus lipolyticus]|uniref:hypothetical protein n=1 Tax=Halorussus lipolyticus TaxID=3034024 RepID=UPI0023E8B8C0|nr:hypothetical protein [Halorussus sp. DT80]
MTQLEAFDDDVEVEGRAVRSMLEGVGELSSVFEKRMQETLDERGIGEPQAGEWYPQEAYLDAVASIEDSIGSQTFRNIGKKLPEKTPMPPAIDTVDEALEAVEKGYEMNHRGGDSGYYEFEDTGENEKVVHCKNPYPCDLDVGLITAVAEEFSSDSAIVTVEEESDVCRDDGGDECIYRVSW